jgi:hypothetical protein
MVVPHFFAAVLKLFQNPCCVSSAAWNINPGTALRQTEVEMVLGTAQRMILAVSYKRE